MVLTNDNYEQLVAVFCGIELEPRVILSGDDFTPTSAYKCNYCNNEDGHFFKAIMNTSSKALEALKAREA